MSAVPPAADEMPVPEPVPAVVTVTCGNVVLYCGTHRLNSGYSSVLPVSDNAIDEDAGELGSALAAADDEDAALDAADDAGADADDDDDDDEPHAATEAAAATARTGRISRRTGL
jgi:hypothetical protein